MKKKVKLTLEQFKRLMSEGIIYDVDNTKENPRVLSVAQQNNGNIGLGTFNNGANSEEPAIVSTDVDKVADTARELKTQGLNATLVTPANGADANELAKAETEAKNAGAESLDESIFTKKNIIEMRLKYLGENSKSYAKKDFHNRRNGR